LEYLNHVLSNIEKYIHIAFAAFGKGPLLVAMSMSPEIIVTSRCLPVQQMTSVLAYTNSYYYELGTGCFSVCGYEYVTGCVFLTTNIDVIILKQ